MLHHFQGKIDIGTGNGGIISQLKMQNEMKLTDESWISYQQGKGNFVFCTDKIWVILLVRKKIMMYTGIR
mgnify:CR=1 FL=1